MKVYELVVEFGASGKFDSHISIGIFSSKEKADVAYNNVRMTDFVYTLYEYEIDVYYTNKESRRLVKRY